MPLSAAFGFFSSFHSKKKLLHQSFSPHLSFSLLLFFFISERPHSAPFLSYIRNLPHYTIKYNKKSGDLIAKLPSPINTLYKRFY